MNAIVGSLAPGPGYLISENDRFAIERQAQSLALDEMLLDEAELTDIDPKLLSAKLFQTRHFLEGLLERATFVSDEPPEPT